MGPRPTPALRLWTRMLLPSPRSSHQAALSLAAVWTSLVLRFLTRAPSFALCQDSVVTVNGPLTWSSPVFISVFPRNFRT